MSISPLYMEGVYVQEITKKYLRLFYIFPSIAVIISQMVLVAPQKRGKGDKSIV